MSRRSRLIGLAIAIAILAYGFDNKANAGIGACKPVKEVKTCAPVKAETVVPACKPVTVVPACKPVKALPPPPPACKPVKTCEGVDTYVEKHAVVHEHLARIFGHIKGHKHADKVYYDAPATSAPATAPSKSPTPAPAPALPAPPAPAKT
jgi:hypothetical protein